MDRFYLKHKFRSRTEIAKLIVCYFPGIPLQPVQRILVEKLESLSNVYLNPVPSSTFILLLRTTEIILSCSIILVYWMRLFMQNQKVSFEYVEYHTDKLYSRREDGTQLGNIYCKSISDGSTAN